MVKQNKREKDYMKKITVALIFFFLANVIYFTTGSVTAYAVDESNSRDAATAKTTLKRSAMAAEALKHLGDTEKYDPSAAYQGTGGKAAADKAAADKAAADKAAAGESSISEFAKMKKAEAAAVKKQIENYSKREDTIDYGANLTQANSSALKRPTGATFRDKYKDYTAETQDKGEKASQAGFYEGTKQGSGYSKPKTEASKTQIMLNNVGKAPEAAQERNLTDAKQLIVGNATAGKTAADKAAADKAAAEKAAAEKAAAQKAATDAKALAAEKQAAAEKAAVLAAKAAADAKSATVIREHADRRLSGTKSAVEKAKKEGIPSGTQNTMDDVVKVREKYKQEKSTEENAAKKAAEDAAKAAEAAEKEAREAAEKAAELEKAAGISSGDKTVSQAEEEAKKAKNSVAAAKKALEKAIEKVKTNKADAETNSLEIEAAKKTADDFEKRAEDYAREAQRLKEEAEKKKGTSDEAAAKRRADLAAQEADRVAKETAGPKQKVKDHMVKAASLDRAIKSAEEEIEKAAKALSAAKAAAAAADRAVADATEREKATSKNNDKGENQSANNDLKSLKDDMANDNEILDTKDIQAQKQAQNEISPSR